MEFVELVILLNKLVILIIELVILVIELVDFGLQLCTVYMSFKATSTNHSSRHNFQLIVFMYMWIWIRTLQILKKMKSIFMFMSYISEIWVLQIRRNIKTTYCSVMSDHFIPVILPKVKRQPLVEPSSQDLLPRILYRSRHQILSNQIFPWKEALAIHSTYS